MFGLPLIVYHMTVIFFDRSAFEKANLPVPTPGWTLADFKQTINALSNARDRHYVFMDNSHLQGSILAPFVDANLTSQNGEINAESLSGVVQWYVSASEQNKIYSMRNITDLALEKENLRSLFESEYPPAMWIGSLRDYSTMEPVEIDTNKFKADKLGVVPLPVDPDRSDSNTTPVWAQCAAISAASSHPREAWLLISFLSNQEPPFDNHFGMVSARQSVTTGSHLWKSLSPEVEAVVRFGLEHAWYGSQYPEAFTVLDSALMETLWMNKPLPDAIASTRNYSADSPAPTPDQTVFSIATPLPKHPSSEGVTSIRFYASLPTRENVQAFQAVVEEFHRLFPDISVNWRADLSDVHFETGQNKLSTLAANFDCFSSDFIPGKNLSDSGLLNLNVLLENEGPGFTKDFFPAIMDLYRMGGNQFGLPVTSRPWIMAYNADLLARRGLEPPAIDWDFHEFIRLITAATSTSEIDRSYGYLYWTWDNFLIQGGGVSWEDVNSYPPVLRLDSPKMQQVVSWINNLKQSGVLMYMGRGGNEEIQLSALKQAFLSGRIAFWITEAGYPKGWWTDEGDMPYKIGVAPMPAIDQKRQSLNGSTEYGLFISSSAPNPQACWTFMKFLSGQPKAFPGVPTRQSVASSAAWTNSVGYENANVYRQALSQAAHSEVTAIETDPVFWWLVDAITFVFDGSDPTQELTAAQYKVDTYVACMGNTEFFDSYRYRDPEASEDVFSEGQCKMILINILIGCLISVVSVIIIVRQVLMIATVEQNSMAPTIYDGERLLIFRPWPARWLRRGQIVLIYPPEKGCVHNFSVSKPYVKRVIGLPGETVTINLSDKEQANSFNLLLPAKGYEGVVNACLQQANVVR